MHVCMPAMTGSGRAGGVHSSHLYVYMGVQGCMHLYVRLCRVYYVCVCRQTDS